MNSISILHLRRFFLTSILISITTSGLAAPPDADWFPDPKPLGKPTGDVIQVATVKQLFSAMQNVKPGGTIVLADGHYLMPRYIEMTTDNVTLRSVSGDRHKVVLDGATSRHGELLGITNCVGVTIADLTIQNVKFNGIKINSDRGAQRVTVHNCVLHNIWQRGIKAPGLRNDDEKLRPRNCRVQFCLFYNDRPKQFSDDETDTPKTFNGNYIGGIDVKNTTDWIFRDNVFMGIQGRTREGRGCIYISENGQGATIERNVFLNCDIAVALGNPSLEYSQYHAVGCTVRENVIADCPETGILGCYTKDCQIEKNTIHDPESSRGRLIWVQNVNDNLKVTKNVLVGRNVLVTSKSKIEQQANKVMASWEKAKSLVNQSGQSWLTHAQVGQAIQLPEELAKQKRSQQTALLKPGVQSEAIIKAMKKVHSGFKGQSGYVAQFGDSITFSMAFWTPIGWDNPDQYLKQEDGLGKTPAKLRWRDYVKGTRNKGPKFANYSGWKVGQLNNAIDSVLERDKPEFAIIMIGTNDISGGSVPKTYRETLEKVLQKCLDAHCIPILNTIPPRRGRDQAVADTNKIIRDVSKKMQIPLADFHAECIRLRPDNSWNGTIISKDGVHPSGGKSNVYTEENMKNCGYALRNWVNFLVLRQLYFRVLSEGK